MFGLYVHWPFCLSKCIYCDFGSKVLSLNNAFDKDFQQKYCDCCKKQMQYFQKKIQQNKYQKELTSIYFGGGTPSLLNEDIVKQLIDEAKNLFNLSNDCEITLEANPTSFELEKFYKFNEVGINRLSLGVQSFDDNELAWLGRKHSAKQAIYAIEEIKKIFPKWSFDLIYGLPKQKLEKWVDELNFALALEPKHLSLYTLIVDEHTPLGRMVQTGNVVPKTDDEMADFYDTTNEVIKKTYLNKLKKLQQYEVSNYAVSGFESQHNLCYWHSHDYVGIGSMAHGRLTYCNNERYEIINKQDVNEWMFDVENGLNGLEVEKPITRQEQVEEILIMGLRTKYGIDLAETQRRFGIDILEYCDVDKIKMFENQGLLLINNQRMVLTYEGLKILDSILAKILT